MFPVEAVKILRELAKQKEAGPSPSFTEYHLSKALEIIGGKGPIGRIKLSEKLKLGKGATRTLIAHLQMASLVKTSKSGCVLTEKGLAILNELKSKLLSKVSVPSSSMTVGTHNLGIHVRDAGHKVRYGIEQRDAAVRAGAIGATTTIFRDGKLFMPPISRTTTEDWPKIVTQLLEIFHPEENDVIIVCGADTEERAEDGALAAAWTLLEE
ncbi:MAG: DUF4443 domain-containing protein [Candidatus Geothermarchaeales archaeon]